MSDAIGKFVVLRNPYSLRPYVVMEVARETRLYFFGTGGHRGKYTSAKSRVGREKGIAFFDTYEAAEGAIERAITAGRPHREDAATWENRAIAERECAREVEAKTLRGEPVVFETQESQ